MQLILQRALPGLQPDAAGITIPGNPPQGAFKVQNKHAILRAAADVKHLPGFEDHAESILKFDPLTYPGDPIVLGQEEWGRLSSWTSKLHTRGSILLSALDAVLAEPDPLTVSIRIPHANDLNELQEKVGRIQSSIQDVTRRIFNESFVLKGFDVGSEWLVLAVSANLILIFIGKLMQMSYQYLAYGAQLQRQEEDARRFGIETEHLHALQKANAVMLDAYARKMAESLNAKYAPEPVQNENVNHTFVAIKEISRLLREGMEVRAALNAAPDAKEAFEKPNELIAAVQPLLLVDGDHSAGKESGDRAGAK
jgi:hypothetical protein